MADVRDPNRDQPLPTAGRTSVQDALIAAIADRRDYGIRKYGRPLETFNGRDALKDAWEEALDLTAYLTQALMERDTKPDDPTPTAVTGRADSVIILTEQAAIAWDEWCATGCGLRSCVIPGCYRGGQYGPLHSSGRPGPGERLMGPSRWDARPRNWWLTGFIVAAVIVTVVVFT